MKQRIVHVLLVIAVGYYIAMRGFLLSRFQHEFFNGALMIGAMAVYPCVEGDFGDYYPVKNLSYQWAVPGELKQLPTSFATAPVFYRCTYDYAYEAYEIRYPVTESQIESVIEEVGKYLKNAQWKQVPPVYKEYIASFESTQPVGDSGRQFRMSVSRKQEGGQTFLNFYISNISY